MTIRATFLILGLAGWSTSAAAEAVSFADLQGAVIEVGVVHEVQVRREGKVRASERHITGQIKIGPEDTIATTFTTDSIRNGNTRARTPRSARFTLGKPRKSGIDDDVIWTFSDSSLVRLRAFGSEGAGGQQMVVEFRRNLTGLECSVSMPFVRENGTGPLRTQSRDHGNVPVEILEFKPISSSCHVVKSDKSDKK